MLAYIRDVVKPDIVVWTGDTVPHDLWSESSDDVVNDIVKAS
jgi:hypothetical protein